MPNETVYIALDFGNTRVKCFVEDLRLLAAFTYDDGSWCDRLVSIILNECGSKNAIIGISSVNPEMSLRCAEELQKVGLHIENTANIILERKLIDCSAISGMGDDRLHGLLGALELAKPPLITIDCGTAITFNVLDEHGICLGGAIIPGFSTMLNALHNQASLLPALKPVKTASLIGKTTKDAIMSGVNSVLAGGIKTMLTEYPNAAIIIMGGDGELLQSLLSPDIAKKSHYVENGIARGIFRALKLGI